MAGLFLLANALTPLKATTIEEFGPEYNVDYNVGWGGVEQYGRLHTPAGYDPVSTPTKTYPLIVFFHGIGERYDKEIAGGGPGNTWQIVSANNITDLFKHTKDAAFLYAPQAGGSGWNDTTLANVMAGVAKIMNEYKIARDQVYVTGLSLGGGACWTAMMKYPVFAAGIPICGVPPNAGSDPAVLAGMPIWAFHNIGDPTVYVGNTRTRVNEIRAAQGLSSVSFPVATTGVYTDGSKWFQDPDHPELQYSECSGTTHGVWYRAYSDNEAGHAGMLYAWMWSKRKTVTPLQKGEKILFDFGNYSLALDGSSRQLPDSQGRVWNCSGSPTGSYGPEKTLGYPLKPALTRTSAGRQTLVGMTVTGTFSGYSVIGGTSGMLYDAEISKDSFITASGGTASLKIYGLASGSAYRLSIYATGTDSDGSYGRITRYQAGGSYADLNAYNNVSTQAVVSGTADAEGTLTLMVMPKPGSTTRYGMISAMEIAPDAANQPPVAVADAVTMKSGTSADIAVLANDYDPDNSPQALTLAGAGTPGHGTATVVSGTLLRYTPTAGYTGADTVTYTISDGSAQASGTVSITVNPADAAELMRVDFNSSADYLTYMQASSPGQNQFNDISAESAGGTWSISSGRLSIARTSDTSSSCGAGITRWTPLAGSPTALKVSFDLTLANVTTSYVDLFCLEFGNFTALADYNGSISYTPIHNRLLFKSIGTGLYSYTINGTNSPAYAASGTSTPVIYWMNASGAAVSYQTPDGTVRSLGNNQLSLWVGGTGGALLFNSVAKESGFGASVINTFRFRMTGPNYTATIDNLVITPNMMLSSANLPPVAADDSATLNEGASVDVNVLANDSDPDGGPQALSIASVGTPAHGTASIVSGKVRYAPAPGYYGSDSVTYTITDGSAQASARVNFTVADTSVAHNLLDCGLGGVNVGSAAGSSRELASGQWEISGSGAGISGTADALHGEFASVSGDFVMTTRVDELQAAAGGRVGLTAREGFASGDRAVAVGVNPSRQALASVRPVANGAVSETTLSGSANWLVPGTWLLIQREGNTLTAAVSHDGDTYEQVAAQDLSYLATTLQLGVWVTGGTSAAGRGVVSEFALTQDTTLFTQNYDRWGTAGALGDYISAAPEIDQADDISAEADGGVWSIVSTGTAPFNGKLTLTRSVASSGSNNAAGITRLSGTDTVQALAVSFKVSVNGINTFGDLVTLDLGEFSSIADYSSTSVSRTTTNRLLLKGTGNGVFTLRLNGTNSASSFSANGTEVKVQWFLNHTAATISYQGPDLSAQTIAPGKCDLWANGVKLFDDYDRSGYSLTGTSLGGFRLRTTTDQAMTLTIDDFDMTLLP